MVSSLRPKSITWYQGVHTAQPRVGKWHSGSYTDWHQCQRPRLFSCPVLLEPKMFACTSLMLVVKEQLTSFNLPYGTVRAHPRGTWLKRKLLMISGHGYPMSLIPGARPGGIRQLVLFSFLFFSLLTYWSISGFILPQLLCVESYIIGAFLNLQVPALFI